MPAESVVRKARRVVIACRVMEPELTSVLSEGGAGDDVPEIIYLDQVLHRTPGKLLSLVQEKIDKAAQTASRIVLGYGLCSNGVVGVTARQQGLIIPRCHDCIGLFLGSPARYQEIFHSKPGTYYLTPGLAGGKERPARDHRGAGAEIRPGDGPVGGRGGAEALHPHRPDQHRGGGDGPPPGPGDGERGIIEQAVRRDPR